ncbi:MAG: hypothetical protein J6Z02_02980, partial [Lachnospiraceae bacterium]|nr:hypothetical protein [Lachnospiraceae bacterium]
MKTEKKTILKRMTVLMLAAMMSVSVLAGCDSDKKQNNNNQQVEDGGNSSVMPAPIDDPEKGTGDDMVHIFKAVTTLSGNEY